MKFPYAKVLRKMGMCLAVLPLFVAGFAMSGELPATPLAAPFETRCGWFDNPTPGNMTLYDRDGAWVIGGQGGYQVANDWDWPEFAPQQWVRTNGNYGYGCVCMRVQVVAVGECEGKGQDSACRRIGAIAKTRAQSLAVCRKDRALAQWGELFP